MAKKNAWPWVPRKKDEALADKVERLKRITGHEDENGKSDDLFNEIAAAHDPAAIPLLLLMRPYKDDCDLSDEREQIIRSMKDWKPQDKFMDEFMKALGELCRSRSPVMLQTLLDDILWNDKRGGLFIARLDRLTADERAGLTKFIEGREKRRETVSFGMEPEQKANYDKVVARLSALGKQA